MNCVQLIGRLTADPKVSYTSESQMAICKFKVAVDRPTKDRATDFIPITVFGKTAENCGKYLAKGGQVGVMGRIQTGSYEKSDGTIVYTTDVVADRVDFIWGEKKQEKDSVQETFEAIDADVPF